MVIVVISMGYKVVRSKLESALEGFKVSFGLSLFGTIVEFLVVIFAYNIILLTDLAHWLIDTTLEGLFMISVRYASRNKKFPLGTLVLESVLVTLATASMISIYGYFFASYFLEFEVQDLSGVYHPGMAVVTVLGGVLTSVTMLVQRKKYNELKLEIVKADYVHAIIDTVAAFLATVGIILVSFTKNPGVEALFTSILTLFVFHSVVEVFGDTFKTITGRNIDPQMRLSVLEKLIKELNGIEVKQVDARKIGSFYIVSVNVRVNPRLTISEAYKLRSKIVELVREVSDLVYHVDVSIAPTKRVRKKKR